ncbi:MAG: TetR family transcriptional regulator [Nocardioides sp.]|uniref:TetR family transcriptional regulator n=1 Tax=Nocardioides sp. TaxID=35761 RepID=UPI003F08475A
MDRREVVDTALGILGRVGLPDLTMRRLGTELGVQQSAIYHHFANKQELLGAVADEILARGPHTDTGDAAGWLDQVRAACHDVRAAVLAFSDGADVVSSMFAFGLGGREAYDRVDKALAGAGLAAETEDVAVRTLLHFVFGHAIAQQTAEQAARVGAIDASSDPDDFAAGLGLVLAGVAAAATA